MLAFLAKQFPCVVRVMLFSHVSKNQMTGCVVSFPRLDLYRVPVQGACSRRLSLREFDKLDIVVNNADTIHDKHEINEMPEAELEI